MFSVILNSLFSDTGFFIVFLCILVLTILMVTLLFFQRKPILINRPLGIISILLIGMSILVCTASIKLGTVYIKTSGNPSEVVDAFFSSIVNGNYNQAYLYLSDYATLELENNNDGSEDVKLINKCLRDSYSYELTGFPKTEGLVSTQSVRFTFLDINKVKDDAEARIDGILNEKVQSLPRNQLYNDNGDYLPELLDQVYFEALTRALENASSLTSTIQYEVSLSYSNNKWTLKTNEQMLKGFLGEK